MPDSRRNGLGPGADPVTSSKADMSATRRLSKTGEEQFNKSYQISAPYPTERDVQRRDPAEAWTLDDSETPPKDSRAAMLKIKKEALNFTRESPRKTREMVLAPGSEDPPVRAEAVSESGWIWKGISQTFKDASRRRRRARRDNTGSTYPEIAYLYEPLGRDSGDIEALMSGARYNGDPSIASGQHSKTSHAGDSQRVDRDDIVPSPTFAPLNDDVGLDISSASDTGTLRQSLDSSLHGAAVNYFTPIRLHEPYSTSDGVPSLLPSPTFSPSRNSQDLVNAKPGIEQPVATAIPVKVNDWLKAEAIHLWPPPVFPEAQPHVRMLHSLSKVSSDPKWWDLPRHLWNEQDLENEPLGEGPSDSLRGQDIKDLSQVVDEAAQARQLSEPDDVTTPEHWDLTYVDDQFYGASYSDSDRESVISQADSIFSVASIASTASEFSAASGYSAAQIDSATKELLQLFLEDEVLSDLYKVAMQRTEIGSERLQRNIRRLLKIYAQNLQTEADSDLEKLAARLVHLKSAYVARSIVHRFEIKPEVAVVLDPQTLSSEHLSRNEASDEEDEEDEDEEALDDAVDENLIRDLTAFRRFLAEGSAFTAFQRQLEAFVFPKAVVVNKIVENPIAVHQEQATEIKEDKMSNVETSLENQDNSTVWAKILRTGMSLLVASGCLEPPLDFGWVRLRWQCACGDAFFGDVKEYRAGGVIELIKNMNRATGAKVSVTPYSMTSANQNWTFKLPAWVRRLGNGSSSGQSRASSSTGSLPLHNLPSQMTPSVASIPTVATVSAAPPSLHLLTCAHRTQRRKYLLQDSIGSVSTDKALFEFMKQQLKRNQSRIRSFLSMRSVQGLFFVKFRLRMGNTVEVRDHNPCCTSTAPNTCECIPPATKVEPSPNAEYRCTPAGPLATWPPVLSQDLMHMLSSPQCINEHETWVLEQLPKRTAGELLERVGPPVEGWGIYHQEGIDFDMIITVVFVVFLLASLIFAILWTKFKMDIQGAFGVSSYMITAIGIFLAMVASRAKNFG